MADNVTTDDIKLISEYAELTELDTGDFILTEDITDNSFKKITETNFKTTTGITANTTHKSSDGKDHSDVVLNNTHRASDGKDHSDVVLNNTHRASDGTDHSHVILNDTHRASDGKDHSDVVLNNTHRTSDGSDHTFVDQSVISGASPTLDGANITGVDPAGIDITATNRLLGRSTAGAGVSEEITVAGDITQSGSTFTIGADKVTYDKMQDTSATDRLLGRSTALGGTIEEITVAGDITQSGSDFTIADDAVTYAKMQNVTATDKLLGRDTAGAGVVEELGDTAVKTMLALENVSNTADAAKPVSTAGQTALDLKAPLASPSFTGTVTTAGAIELGHASDTTLARDSAGVISVEGVEITNNTKAQTLTNKSLTAPVISTIELGHATDTTIARDSAGVASIEGEEITTNVRIQTLANKTLTSPKLNEDVVLSATATELNAVTANIATNVSDIDTLEADLTTSISPDITNEEPTNKTGDGSTDISAVIVDGSASVEIQGKSYDNQGEDTWATALTGWTSTYDSIVSEKYRLTHSADATGERDISTILDVTKNYLVTTLAKSVTDTTGGKFDVIDGTGGASIVASTTVTATQTKRIGLILQASDLTATSPFLQMTHKGNGYTNFDQFTIVELTSAEYAEGLTAMLDKYTYISGLQSSLPCDVESVGVNLLDPAKLEIGNILDSDGTDIGNNAYMRTGFMPVNSGLIYARTVSASYYVRTLVSYDGNFNFISSSQPAIAQATSDTLADGVIYLRHVVRRSDSGDLDLDDMNNIRLTQLGLSAPSATYVPFTLNHAHIPVTTHQVPTARDTFDVDTGVLGVNVQTGALGAELVTDGDMATAGSWTASGGADVNSTVAGKAYFDGATNGYIEQNITITSGKLYKVDFDLTNATSATLRLLSDSAGVFGADGIAKNTKTGLVSGHYSYYFVCSSTISGFRFYGESAGSSFELDNLSIKEIATTNGTPISTTDEDEVRDDGTTAIYELADASKETIQYPPQTLVAYLGGQMSRIPTLRDNAISVSGTVTMGTIPISRMGDVWEYIGATASLVDPADITHVAGAMTYDVAGGGSDEVYDYVAYYDTSYSTYPTQVASFPYTIKSQINGNIVGISNLQKQVQFNDRDIKTSMDRIAVLEAIQWKDINVGIITFSQPAATIPDVVQFVDEAAADTGIYTYGFAVGEKVSGNFEIQHDYQEGTDLYFHVHFQGSAAPSGVDKIKWQLTYTKGVDGATLDAVTVIVKESDYDTQYAFVDSDFAAITGTAFAIEDQFLFTLERIAASADEYAGDAIVATVGLHYQVDTRGSLAIDAK